MRGPLRYDDGPRRVRLNTPPGLVLLHPTERSPRPPAPPLPSVVPHVFLPAA